MFEFSFLIGAIIATLVGINKMGMKGVGMVSIYLITLIFATKQSVGALLPILLFADILAVLYYHSHTKWNYLRKLLPTVLVGMVFGIFILNLVDDSQLRFYLGLLIAIMLTFDIVRRNLKIKFLNTPYISALLGIFAGAATIVGNAAGPIASLYFLSKDMSKNEFIGTGAWFFLIINTIKFPIFYSLGMITKETLLFDVKALPFIFVGAIIGWIVIKRIPEHIYIYIIYTAIALASLRLLF